MARILSIDYGTKRTGIAVSDPLQIIANGLDTVPTHQLMPYLAQYFSQEEVETIVLGEPLHMDGNPAQLHSVILKLAERLRKKYPDKEVVLQDERFTSEDAKRAILMSGAKKKKRRDKALVDKISAVIILQDYMESKRSNG